MKIIGITGSLSSGKSTVAKFIVEKKITLYLVQIKKLVNYIEINYLLRSYKDHSILKKKRILRKLLN